MAALTRRAFLRWAETARPGERLAYHRGFLAMDTGRDTQDAARLLVVARAARGLAAGGCVGLVQRRLGPEAYEYLAVRL